MPEYEYEPLDVDTGEIRLVELHPGAFDDPIKISIITKPLVIPAPVPVQGDRLEQIRNSLPAGMWAYETLEGRILFDNSIEDMTTWEHPNPSYDHCSYE
ncbi:hypothetical protein CC86DRAFT_241168, partial [Ophiobolus disseminans]